MAEKDDFAQITFRASTVNRAVTRELHIYIYIQFAAVCLNFIVGFSVF